jgi:lipoprotein signal peptidase
MKILFIQKEIVQMMLTNKATSRERTHVNRHCPSAGQATAKGITFSFVDDRENVNFLLSIIIIVRSGLGNEP